MRQGTSKLVVAIYTFVMLLSQLPITTMAYGNSLHVLGYIDKDLHQYQAGDTVHLTIHVFDKGVPLDPEHLNA